MTLHADSIARVGIGTDLHRMERGGPLRLAGIEIPFEYHLMGHSDADVVLHAVCDALLGAAGLGDIGEQFPDSDERYRGVDSRELLAAVAAKVVAAGYRPVNLDLTIHAQQPKLSPYKAAMRDSIAAILGMPAEAVSVKAKTNEGVDAVGRAEAIACTCVVGLCRVSD